MGQCTMELGEVLSLIIPSGYCTFPSCDVIEGVLEDYIGIKRIFDL